MREELLRRGRHVGKKRVARIMKENALWPQPKRRFVLTTHSEKGQEVAENLLDRNFDVLAVSGRRCPTASIARSKPMIMIMRRNLAFMCFLPFAWIVPA